MAVIDGRTTNGGSSIVAHSRPATDCRDRIIALLEASGSMTDGVMKHRIRGYDFDEIKDQLTLMVRDGTLAVEDGVHPKTRSVFHRYSLNKP